MRYRYAEKVQDYPCFEAKETVKKISRRKQGAKSGAFAVHTVRQSRAGGLETTGFFGSSKAR